MIHWKMKPLYCVHKVFQWFDLVGIRTKSLPDKIPSAHFCIGGHNPSHVFCNVDIIPPTLFYKVDKIPSVNFPTRTKPLPAEIPYDSPSRSVLHGHLLFGYYFILFLNCGQGLKLHQQLLGGSNFLHWLFLTIASSSSENSNKTTQPQFLGPSLPFK